MAKRSQLIFAQLQPGQNIMVQTQNCETAFNYIQEILASHGEMNRFLMTKTTREMRVVLKCYLNNPQQLLFNGNPKILSSKNYLLAHWSP